MKHRAILIAALALLLIALPTQATAWCGTPQAEPSCPEFHKPTPVPPTPRPHPTDAPKPTSVPPTAVPPPTVPPTGVPTAPPVPTTASTAPPAYPSPVVVPTAPLPTPPVVVAPTQAPPTPQATPAPTRAPQASPIASPVPSGAQPQGPGIPQPQGSGPSAPTATGVPVQLRPARQSPTPVQTIIDAISITRAEAVPSREGAGGASLRDRGPSVSTPPQPLPIQLPRTGDPISDYLPTIMLSAAGTLVVAGLMLVPYAIISRRKKP